MAFLSLDSLQQKKRTHVVAIDLGARKTKALALQRRGQGFDLANYVILDAPSPEKPLSPEILAPHLKAVMQELGAKTKQVVLSIGVNDSLLRQVELPAMPRSEMRQVLRYGSKNYLQQDLSDHVFDCHILPPRAAVPGGPDQPRAALKCKALVGGAKKSHIEMLQASCKEAGLSAEQVAVGMTGPANAFEKAVPESFEKEVVALVDIGFKSSTIAILLHGELALNRVVGLGGDRLTLGLAETMGVSYDDAEKMKIELPDEAQLAMSALLIPLGRELRASIDFFEHQQEKNVAQIYLSGGSAQSRFLVESIQSELIVPCKTWNPVSFLGVTLPPQKVSLLEQDAPQLAVAAGAAVVAAF